MSFRSLLQFQKVKRNTILWDSVDNHWILLKVLKIALLLAMWHLLCRSPSLQQLGTKPTRHLPKTYPKSILNKTQLEDPPTTNTHPNGPNATKKKLQTSSITPESPEPYPSIWAIHYKSLTWFKAILGRIPLLNHHLGWPSPSGKVAINCPASMGFLPIIPEIPKERQMKRKAMRWSSHCDSSIIAFWFHGKHLQQQRLHHPKLRCAFKMQKSWNIYETIWKNHEKPRQTILKTNKAPENKPSQKERIIFQPSIFLGFCC